MVYSACLHIIIELILYLLDAGIAGPDGYTNYFCRVFSWGSGSVPSPFCVIIFIIVLQLIG